MHQSALNLEQFCSLFEQLTHYQQSDVGGVLTTTGVHPQLGTVVVIQDVEPGLIMFSQLPIEGSNLADTRLM